MSNVRLQFKLDNAEYQQKMKEMVAQMKEMSSAYGVTQAEAKAFGSQSDVLKSKIAELTSAIEKQKDKVILNEDQHKKLSTALEAEKKHHAELKTKLDDVKDAYEKSKAETGENSEETQKLKNELSKLSSEYDRSEDYIKRTTTALSNQQTKTNESKIALANMQAELKKHNAELAKAPFDNFASGCEKVSSACEKVGQKLMVVSGAIVAAGAAATKSAIEFEDAFAGVEKTVDATPEQLAEISQGIKDMAEEIPATTTEIAAVAEAAGQLGIKTNDILSFTEVMINLGVATNLSSDEAASALAKFANVTKMSADDYGRLGSTIVALGNNFATTESDIVSMATRLASTGEIVGLSEAQIMAIATALSSVGIEAEAGGSAIAKLLKQIETAAKMYGTAKEQIDATGYSLRDLELMASLNSKQFKEVAGSLGLTTTELKNYMSNTSELEKFASIAGMTADEFISAWGTDAVSALDAFITGLNDTERNGASAIEILDGMGITEVRLSNAVLALSSSNGIMTEAVGLANEAWEENTALTNEANKRYATMKSRLTICKNAINNVAISFGEKLLPYLEKGVEKVQDLCDKFDGLTDAQQNTVIKVGAVTASIAPCLLAVGKLSGGMGTVTKAIGTVVGKIAGSGGLSGVLSAVCSPVGLVVAAIAALVVGLGYVIATNEDVRNSLLDVLSAIRDSLQPAIDYFKDTVIPDLRAAWESLLTMLKPLGEFLEKIFTDIWTEMLIPALQYCADTVIPDLIETFKNLWENVIKPLAAFVESVAVPVINIVCELLTMLWESVVLPLADALGGMFAKAWEGIVRIWNEFVIPVLNKVIEICQYLWTNVLQPIVEWLWNTLKPVIQNFFDYLADIFGVIEDMFGGLIDFIVGVFTGDWELAWTGIKEFFTGIWDGIVVTVNYVCKQFTTLFGDALSAVGKFFVDIWNGIVEFFKGIPATVGKIIDDIVAWFNSLPEKIGYALGVATAAVYVFFTETVPSAFNACVEAIKGFFTTTIPKFFTDLWNTIVGWGDNVKEFFTVTLPNFFKAIPEKLKEIGSNIIQGLIDGITGMWEKVTGAIKSFIDGFVQGFKDFLGIHSPSTVFKEFGINLIQGLINGITEMLSAAVTAIKNVCDAIASAVSASWSAIKSAASTAWGGIKTTVVNAWDGIKSGVSSAASAVGSTVTGAWNTVKSGASTAWNSVTSTVSGAWDSIKSGVSSAASAVGSTVTGAWNTVKSGASTAWNSVTSTVSGAWDSIKSATSSAASAVGSAATGVWNTVKSGASTAWSGIKTTVTNGWDGVKSATSTAASAVSTAASNAWSGIVSTATSIWNNVKTAITSPINSAKTSISNAINAIKGFFNTTLSFNGIKLPHIGISYDTSGILAEACKLLGLKGVPKFSVSWYKMGGIMTQPTAFGLSGNTVLAGGEAGAEAILPLDSFYTKLSALLDRKFESFVAKNTIHVTTVTTLDGEVIAEKTADRVEDKIVSDIERRR